MQRRPRPPYRDEEPSEAVTTPEEASVTTTGYQPTLTGALAREHVTDLMRTAGASLAAAELRRNPDRTPRRRPLWWLRITRAATPHTA